jgi:Ni/Co efflux regulator RcnB
MRKFASLAVGLPILAVAAAVASAPAYADRDDRHYKNDRNEKYDRREDRRDDRHAAQMRNERAREAQARRFEDRHRAAIHEYYATHYRRHCPPGLERRGNACVSRAQARRWERGRPLPRDVVYYDLPPKLAVEVGPPPRGQRYVRVGADILLIAVGTGLVIDAINDLGR